MTETMAMPGTEPAPTQAGQAPAAPRKKLLIRTWGCQMNVYDSARMADVLAPLGYAPTEAVEEADMVVLNTCHIRERASEKVFSDLGRLRDTKRERAAGGKETIIAVAGCVGREVEVLVTGAGRHPGQLAARSPWLQPVHFSAPAGLIGGMARVRLDAAHPNSLSATLLAATSPVAGLLDPVQPVSEHATA